MSLVASGAPMSDMPSLESTFAKVDMGLPTNPLTLFLETAVWTSSSYCSERMIFASNPAALSTWTT